MCAPSSVVPAARRISKSGECWCLCKYYIRRGVWTGFARLEIGSSGSLPQSQTHACDVDESFGQTTAARHAAESTTVIDIANYCITFIVYTLMFEQNSHYLRATKSTTAHAEAWTIHIAQHEFQWTLTNVSQQHTYAEQYDTPHPLHTHMLRMQTATALAIRKL